MGLREGRIMVWDRGGGAVVVVVVVVGRGDGFGLRWVGGWVGLTYMGEGTRRRI